MLKISAMPSSFVFLVCCSLYLLRLVAICEIIQATKDITRKNAIDSEEDLPKENHYNIYGGKKNDYMWQWYSFAI